MFTRSKFQKSCSPAPARSTGLAVTIVGAIAVRRDPSSGRARQLEAGLGDEVGGDDARATAVADDRNPRSCRTVGCEAREHAVDQLLRRRHAEIPAARHAASTAAESLASAPVCDAAARARPRCPRPRGGRPACPPAGRLPGPRERPAVAEVLAVDPDHAGVLVRRERLDELGGLDIGLIPERGEARDADARTARRAGSARARGCHSGR